MARLPSLLLVTLACSLALPAQASLRFVQGEARDPASGNLLYREDHLLRGAPQTQERLVLYRCPDGRAFARKRVDYRESETAPSFALEDVRSGYREGLERSDGRVRVYAARAGERGERVDLGASARSLVADSGFDRFLRQRWDTLVGGRAQPLAFVVPAFGRALTFQVASLGADRVDGTPVQRFRLKLDGLLGAIGPALEVAYDARDRTLRRFTGLTNLRDDRGRQLRARIDFARPLEAVDAARWEAAQREPLVRCTLGR